MAAAIKTPVHSLSNAKAIAIKRADRKSKGSAIAKCPQSVASKATSSCSSSDGVVFSCPSSDDPASDSSLAGPAGLGNDFWPQEAAFPGRRKPAERNCIKAVLIRIAGGGTNISFSTSWTVQPSGITAAKRVLKFKTATATDSTVQLACRKERIHVSCTCCENNRMFVPICVRPARPIRCWTTVSGLHMSHNTESPDKSAFSTSRVMPVSITCESFSIVTEDSAKFVAKMTRFSLSWTSPQARV